jgi:hypothetical protein
MPVKRRQAKTRIGSLSELAQGLLLDERSVRHSEDGFDGYAYTFHQAPGSLQVPTLGDLWLQHCDVILADWVPAHPGKRLAAWWKFSAPRWVDFDPVMGEPRRMVGGKGRPKVYAGNRLWFLSHEFGIPVEFHDDGLDPNDPPIFESQASYMDRHGLFLPGERKLLKAADFAPEVVVYVRDDE